MYLCLSTQLYKLRLYLVKVIIKSLGVRTDYVHTNDRLGMACQFYISDFFIFKEMRDRAFFLFFNTLTRLVLKRHSVRKKTI